jgi:hypothetical protein
MQRSMSIGIACGMCAMMSSTATADIALAQWTFETNTPADLSNSAASPIVNAEAGVFAGITSQASGAHVTATTDWTTPSGNGSANSFSANDWTSVGDYWQFTTSTVGYAGISISWHQTRSGTGPTTFDLEWSTNGSTWTTLVNDYAVLFNDASNGGAWNSTTQFPNYIFAPVAGPASLDNQATIYFRMSSQVAAAAGGTNRVDNVVISAVVPAPGALALLPLAGLVGARRRRN